MIDNSDHELRFYVLLLLWRLLRWAISASTVVAVITVIYHFGTPRTHSWKCALPGAAIATLTWFAATLDLWLVCHPLRRLYGRLWLAGDGHRDPGLAVHYVAEPAHRGRVQCPDLSEGGTCAACSGSLRATS